MIGEACKALYYSHFIPAWLLWNVKKLCNKSESNTFCWNIVLACFPFAKEPTFHEDKTMSWLCFFWWKYSSPPPWSGGYLTVFINLPVCLLPTYLEKWLKINLIEKLHFSVILWERKEEYRAFCQSILLKNRGFLLKWWLFNYLFIYL